MVSTVDRQYPAKFFKLFIFDSLVLSCEATKWSVLRISLALFCEKVLTENENHHYSSSPIINTCHHLRGISPLCRPGVKVSCLDPLPWIVKFCHGFVWIFSPLDFAMRIFCLKADTG
jgi:hypothetical protein